MTKYYARKTSCNLGHTHASKREAARCTELHTLQLAGQIAGLQVEPQYWFVIGGKELKHENGRRAGYKPDFSYIEGARQIAEDVKAANGFVDRDFPLRAALFRHLWPEIELRITK